MALNVKVGLIGPFDMLKFKNVAKTREKAIQAASANEIVADYAINRNAKALHPDYLSLVVEEILTTEKRAQKHSCSKMQTAGRFRISAPDSIFRSSSIWTAAGFPARIPSAPVRRRHWRGVLP